MCRGVSHTPSMAAGRHNQFPFPQTFQRKGVGAYRIRPSRQRISPNHFPFHKTFQRKGVGAYRIRPSWRREYINHWSGLAIFVACSLTSGRMRYAPTLVRLIFGRGGVFRCAFAHVRAYAIRPYSFWRNLWRASNNGERYFSPEIFYASSYRYFLLAKNFGSSYRYFLVLQIASARRTGTF